MIKLKTLMTISAVVACPYGLTFIAIPQELVGPYGVQLNDGGVLMTRMYGAQVFGIGLVSWLVRGTADSDARRAVVKAFFAIDIVNTLLALFAVLSGATNASGWFEVVMMVPFALGFGYFALNPEKADSGSKTIRRLLASTYDSAMRGGEQGGRAQWRQELLGTASGDVLEIGAGTGLNVEYYREDLNSLVLAEPDSYMRSRLTTRASECGHSSVEVVDAAAERLPWDDGTFDTVVSTLVLCSVQNVRQALAEIRRVLRPEGRLIFLEHVVAHDNSGLRRWQRLLEPIWRPLQGNCHLTRDTAEALTQAGYVVDELKKEDMAGEFALVRPSIRGVATLSSEDAQGRPKL